MISKRDIIEIAHPDVKGTKVIELSTLRELRQQLKDYVLNYSEGFGGITQREVMIANTILSKVAFKIDGVLGVEGEK